MTLSSLFACLCAFSFQFISVLLCTSSINIFLCLVQHVHSCCILWYMMLQCVCVCPSVCHIEMAGPLSTSQCCLLSRELRFRTPVMEQMPLLAFSLSEHWVEAEGEKIYYEKKTFSALRTGLKVIQRTIGQICVHLFKYLTETGEFFHVYSGMYKLPFCVLILACIKNFV